MPSMELGKAVPREMSPWRHSVTNHPKSVSGEAAGHHVLLESGTEEAIHAAAMEHPRTEKKKSFLL